MEKQGYCKIERRNTTFMQLDNGKWMCMSGGCSHAAGLCREVPIEKEKIERGVHFL